MSSLSERWVEFTEDGSPRIRWGAIATGTVGGIWLAATQNLVELIDLILGSFADAAGWARINLVSFILEGAFAWQDAISAAASQTGLLDTLGPAAPLVVLAVALVSTLLLWWSIQAILEALSDP